MKVSIKERWTQLSARDQNTVKMGGIVLGLFLFAQLVWWPLFSKISVVQQQIIQEQSLIEWMTPRVAQLMDAKKQSRPRKNNKSLPAIEKSLQQAGLKSYVTDFSQNAQKQISVSFVDVPFESCMEWLEQAQSQGWSVKQMNATKTDKPGEVKIDLVLG